jgi:two-component system response regulator HydG
VDFDFSGIIGSSPKMQEVLRLVELVAPSEATVLLLGETGTGKELVAQAIHRNSPRRQGPFVVVNCAALPENLLESELFGYERGAFTGATGRREGRFLQAHHGTLLLDEIGELGQPLQAKILRVLQTRQFEPMGGHTIQVDVRIIAATNRELEKDVQDGRFRDDLYYRLNVFAITLPPLRERLEDVPLLAQSFLKLYGEKNRRPVRSLAPAALGALTRYPWPGNIRELENVMERGVIISQGEALTLEDLPPVLHRLGPGPPPGEGEPSLTELERRLIGRTLERVGGDRRQAAGILGISVEELTLKIREYLLEN